MNSFAPVTGKFVSAVWRRILIARIAESTAIALAVASIAGLVLMPILHWRGDSGLPVAEGMFVLGGFCGLVWGISRRPTKFEAAVEADRQLDLHDLLGTVLLLNPNSNSWANSIAAISDDRCRSLRPSSVVVNRLGLRAWGGVGVLGALLFTFALFTARPVDVSAASPLASTSLNSTPINLFNFPNQIARSNSRPPGPGGIDDDANRNFENDTPADSLTAANNNGNHSTTAGPNPATGGGMAISHTADSRHDLLAIHESPSDPSDSGPTAAGMGQADLHAGAPGDSASTVTSPSAELSHRTPPWKSDQWTRDADAAQAAINSGRVPDSDADLVRDYFRRD